MSESIRDEILLLWRDLQVLEKPTGPPLRLIVGPEGAGQVPFIQYVTQKWLCSQGGCGTCWDCIQVKKFAHPDNLWLFPTPADKSEEDLYESFQKFLIAQPLGDLSDWTEILDTDKSLTIRAETVRKVLQSLSLKPFRGGWRSIVFWGADALAVQSVNILLKTLEEPPPQTFFWMMVRYVDVLPATLRSRAQIWHVPPTPQRLMEQILPPMDEAQKRIIFRMIRTLGQAQKFAQDYQSGAWENLRNWLHSLLTRKPISYKPLLDYPKVVQQRLMDWASGLILYHEKLSWPQKMRALQAIEELSRALASPLQPENAYMVAQSHLKQAFSTSVDFSLQDIL